MPSIKEVGGRIRFDIERFDGGYNVKDNPSRISAYESPDCLNVVFDDQGAVTTRPGSAKFNSTLIGSFAIDHSETYNGTLFVWANGAMWKNTGPVGTSFTKVTTTSGKFATGTKVATVVYQDILFSSDGTNGPWKYTGDENFFNMGIDIPSAPTGASGGAGSVSTGTYYYAVSFVNSQAVEGEIGSSSAAVVLTNSSLVNVTQIPIGSSLAGVNSRFIYRAQDQSGVVGQFKKVGEVTGNTTSVFTDSVANGSEGKFPIIDGTKPTPFTTIELHKERLFFDRNDDRSVLGYTEFQNPFISEAESQEPINKGDGEDIIAIASQDDFVTIFKENKSFSILTDDPADDITWMKREIPANLGIVGSKAWGRVQNGIIFVGRQNKKLTGLHFLSGMNVIETNDGKLRSLSISERIEYDLLNLADSTAYDDIVLKIFNNRLYMGYKKATDSVNESIFWLDLNRVGIEGQPGSWAPWDGIDISTMVVHEGNLYSGDSTATGFIRLLNQSAYNDSSAAINSYFWTKEVGGEKEGSLDSYIKDLRELYVWHQKLGDYNMNVRIRRDGDSSTGYAYPVDLDNGGSLWGTMVWGIGPWGGDIVDAEERIVVGRFQGKRFQVRFDNQNTVNQGFKVHRLEMTMNIRRRR